MAVYYDGISLQNQRKVNMDSLLLKKRTLDGQELSLATVCDGVGSLEQGAFAASLAIRMLSVWFDNLKDTSRLGLRLRDHVMDIHQKVYESARNYQVHTASTLSALFLDGIHYYIVHVGDSRIYCARKDSFAQLTQDQIHCGKLTSCLGHEKPPSIFYNEGTLLLIPAILVSGTGVDLARLYAAKSTLQDANILAANSALAQYDALLQDLYGLFGVMQNDHEFASMVKWIFPC